MIARALKARHLAPPVQVGAGFNRDYWARFEQFVRDLGKRCTDVYVVSGPLYLPRRSASGWTLEHPMLGTFRRLGAAAGSPGRAADRRRLLCAPPAAGTPPQLMAVPTHYYKVVLGEVEATSEVAVGAWVMPNSAITPDVPLTAFTVPLSALEEVSGEGQAGVLRGSPCPPRGTRSCLCLTGRRPRVPAGLRFFPAYMSETRRQYVDRAALALQQAGRAQLGPGGAHPNVLLLPGGPSVDGAASSARPSAAGPSAGIIHVCEHTACRLPAEKFWLEDRRPRRKELPEGGGAPRR